MKFDAILKQTQATGLSTDSRDIYPGEIFCATKGEKSHGNEFINTALTRGASVVVTDEMPSETVYVKKSDLFVVEEMEEFLAEAVEYFYPLIPKSLFAITGTNGKTSIVQYFQQLSNLLGKSAASIGTLGVNVGKDKEAFHFFKNYAGEYTTFNYTRLRNFLHILADNGINHVAIEASSHGLNQGRLKNLKFKSAVFCNFSQDHLDYHKNMENYLQSKLQLFKKNLYGDVAFLATGIPCFEQIKNYITKVCKKRVITFGLEGDCKITILDRNFFAQKIKVNYCSQEYIFTIPLIGQFQILNVVAAILLLTTVGVNIEEIIPHLSNLKTVKGRLEYIGEYNKGSIFVDFAHTPDALKTALSELKKLLAIGKKLIVIFGCGGDRDTSKRGLMGRVATELANEVIITDDNPRTEDPAKIRSEILKETKNALEIADREEAIRLSISKLKAGDILLIAGKGHENYQIFGNQKFYFSDIELVKKIII